ncbi:MAG: TlpA family protein disulfide reductase [Hydrocarboniphaga sp.]|uniref:TlpA family protein disulfide reductase n=1 Tax=Hydrocarboniphaga sp. TaxID=2033016 RepID=UPI00262B4A74|nr:TlpA disulfide reductase family protein [Hydrocarboniphaga sp.]MDB5971840.1 TlpA family protein disulfide reductase [Hydrocarboniphaga sp.]
MGLAISTRSSAAAPFVVGIGDQAPEAAGIVLQGPAGTKLTQLRGKVVLVDFWASYCGPCLESMPELNRMRDELFREGYGQDFEILSVATDNEVAKSRRFLERVKVDFPVVADQIGISVQTYKLWRLPSAYLVDRNGRVRMIYAGYGSGYTAEVKERILALLTQPR